MKRVGNKYEKWARPLSGRDSDILSFQSNRGIPTSFPRLVLAFGMIAFFYACTTTPIITSPSAQLSTEINPETRILVIQPLLRFERVETEAVLPAAENQGQAFEQQLLYWAKKEVTARAFDAAEQSSLDPARAGTACEQLTALSNKLVRGIVPEEAKDPLNSIAAVDPNFAVLVQFLRVKVGPGGWWNSQTGEIGSTMSNMLIDAALISCRDGRILWKNEVLLRTLSAPDGKEFMESLRLVYKTLIRK